MHALKKERAWEIRSLPKTSLGVYWHRLGEVPILWASVFPPVEQSEWE